MLKFKGMAGLESFVKDIIVQPTLEFLLDDYDQTPTIVYRKHIPNVSQPNLQSASDPVPYEDVLRQVYGNFSFLQAPLGEDNITIDTSGSVIKFELDLLINFHSMRPSDIFMDHPFDQIYCVDSSGKLLPLDTVVITRDDGSQTAYRVVQPEHIGKTTTLYQRLLLAPIIPDQPEE